MARDLICPACGKFGFKTTDVFVTGESASLKCVLCGEWSAQPKWKTVAMLIAEVEKLEAECKERVSEKMEWLTERNKLQSSLTRSKAEGRREGMEDLVCYMIDNCERETITEEYLQGVLADCIRFFDIAAAIRQQAVQGTEEKADVCGWKPWNDESGCYDTGCGNVQYFSEGNVADNRYKVCPYCGKSIMVKA